MITSLRLVNFKNFADETLRLGPFTLIVGTNASGKSNIRDAFRFLHGIGRGYTLPEIIGGKYGAGGQLEWEQIRGAPNEIARFGQRHFSFEVEMKPATELKRSDFRDTSYSIRIKWDAKEFREFQVELETLSDDSETLFTSTPPSDGIVRDQEGEDERRLYLPFADNRTIYLPSDHPGLCEVTLHLLAPFNSSKPVWNVLESGVEPIVIRSNRAIGELRGARFLELSPERMREPSIPGADNLGDTGDNLPTVLEKICDDSQRKEVLAGWLQELTPMDVVDFEFPRGPNGRVYLQILERDGRKISADSASDGTLRFLGLLAALLSDDQPRFYFFEEIDNGIHPSRLSLLIELIERQTAKGGVQVVATTHSPGLLDLVNDTTFESTSVVYRGEDSADAVIRPVSDLPRVRELRRSQGLGRLHAGGWMEDMLTLKGWREEDARAGQ